jgi:predicted nuclease of predicted toxin-antitoxin system
MDHNVHAEITTGLRARGLNILTAHEDGASELPDDLLLDRVRAQGRVLVTGDVDFLQMATSCLRKGLEFPSIVYFRQDKPLGQVIDDLEMLAQALTDEERMDHLFRVPL